ncbi:MAG: septum formation initiator family protein [Clostridia bacterium]|nr:septum formation initiator family protein [Clostridia bacterium]
MKRLRKKLTDFYKRHSRGIVLTIVLVLSGWFIINGLMQMPTINKNREQTAEVEQKIKEEKDRQAEIDDLTTKVNTDEYIERIASEKLGLVKSNSTIFYDVSEEK